MALCECDDELYHNAWQVSYGQERAVLFPVLSRFAKFAAQSPINMCFEPGIG